MTCQFLDNAIISITNTSKLNLKLFFSLHLTNILISQKKPHTISKPPMDDDDAFESLAHIDISDIDFGDGQGPGKSEVVVNTPEKPKAVSRQKMPSKPGRSTLLSRCYFSLGKVRLSSPRKKLV